MLTRNNLQLFLSFLQELKVMNYDEYNVLRYSPKTIISMLLSVLCGCFIKIRFQHKPIINGYYVPACSNLVSLL